MVIVDGDNMLVIVFIGFGKILVVFLWVLDSLVGLEFMFEWLVVICVLYVLLFKVLVVDVECNLCILLVGLI